MIPVSAALIKWPGVTLLPCHAKCNTLCQVTDEAMLAALPTTQAAQDAAHDCPANRSPGGAGCALGHGFEGIVPTR